jgi:hypothetical protein
MRVAGLDGEVEGNEKERKGSPVVAATLRGQYFYRSVSESQNEMLTKHLKG